LIPKQRLQSETSSLFLRLFFLLDQNRLLAKVQLSSRGLTNDSLHL